MNLPEQIISKIDVQYFSANVFTNNSVIRAYYHQLRKKCLQLRMHSHDFYEINIITKGHATHYLENNIIDAPCGSVFVIPPFWHHGYITEERTDIFHILLHPSFITLYSLEMQKNIKGFGFLFNTEPLLRCNTKLIRFLKLTEQNLLSLNSRFQTLSEYTNIKMPNKNEMQKFLTLNIIAELCSLSYLSTPIHKEQRENHYENEILDIINYINDNRKSYIDFHELANQYALSYPTFYRHFKLLVKLSPMQYQLTLKINDAVQMINAGQTSLTTISQENGFFDVSHFSKQFKKYTGISPTEYIKKVNGK